MVEGSVAEDGVVALEMGCGDVTPMRKGFDCNCV